MDKIILLFLIIFLLVQSTLSSVDQYYLDCQPYQCGSLNITYPFVLAAIQKPYCGYPGFQIGCIKSQPILSLSDDRYTITNINYELQTLQVTNSAFLNGCSTPFHNLTLDRSKFEYSHPKKEIFLLQDCKKSVFQNVSSREKIKCSDGNGTSKTVLTLDEEDLGRFGELRKVCREVITVPYEEEFGASVTDVKGMLGKGIVLKWLANNCSRCAGSGGRCGYENNTLEFKCFCPDRPHLDSCNDESHSTHSSRENSRTKKLGIIVGSAISGVIILLAISIIVFWRLRKIKQGSFRNKARTLESTKSDLVTSSMLYGLPLFSYDDLKDTTNNFDATKEIGGGGFGTVYHGKLRDGREVAVKRLYEKNYKQIEQFMNEIQILTCLRHKNLVSLYGCTSHLSRELLLVYEYLPNGTVADHLHGDKADSKSLTWPIRMNIAIETASALSYLHASEIIHRDVKTNNILLDNDFSVRVADFGLSRLFPSDVTHVSTVPQGTPGYVDPKYHQCYHLTAKSDVYSFGVVLVELISSLPAVDIHRHGHEINLSNYAMNRIQCSAFSELADPNLGFDSNFKVKRMITLVAKLAFQCLQHEREHRPSMEEVLEALRGIASADYDMMKAEEAGRKAGLGRAPLRSTKLPPSPTENDDVGLLRNAQHPPPLPDSVMDKWMGKSTTPNTSI